MEEEKTSPQTNHKKKKIAAAVFAIIAIAGLSQATFMSSIKRPTSQQTMRLLREIYIQLHQRCRGL